MRDQIISGEDMLKNIKNNNELLSGVVEEKIPDSYSDLVKSVGFSRISIKDLRQAINDLPDDMAIYLDDIVFQEGDVVDCVSYIRICNKNSSIFSHLPFYDRYAENK